MVQIFPDTFSEKQRLFSLFAINSPKHGIYICHMAFSLLRLPEQSKCPKVDKRSSTTVCWLWRSVVKREKKSSVISFTGRVGRQHSSVLFTPFHPLSHPDRNFLIPGSVRMLQELTLVVKNDSGHLTVFLLNTGQLVCSCITDKQSNKSCVKNIVKIRSC